MFIPLKIFLRKKLQRLPEEEKENLDTLRVLKYLSHECEFHIKVPHIHARGIPGTRE